MQSEPLIPKTKVIKTIEMDLAGAQETEVGDPVVDRDADDGCSHLDTTIYDVALVVTRIS